MSASQPAARAHIADSAYTKSRLPLYDFTLRLACGLLWGCPTSRVLNFYDERVSGNHLDVGVGSGYFLDKCRYPVSNPRLALLDSNPDPLEYCAARLARYHPETIQANILQPIPYTGAPFESVGLNHVVHCLPGTMQQKSAVFRNLKALMAPGAQLFGATVLVEGVRHNWAGAKWIAHFNKLGIIDNLHDSREGLKAALDGCFQSSSVEVIGRTALFYARA